MKMAEWILAAMLLIPQPKTVHVDLVEFNTEVGVFMSTERTLFWRGGTLVQWCYGHLPEPELPGMMWVRTYNGRRVLVTFGECLRTKTFDNPCDRDLKQIPKDELPQFFRW